MGLYPSSGLYPAENLYPEVGDETPPLVATGAPTAITNESATLHGTVTPQSDLQAWGWFEYGHTTAYGMATPIAIVGRLDDPVAIAADIDGLTAGAPVHFRAVAANFAGTAYGEDVGFMTLSEARPTPQSSLALHAELIDVTGKTYRWSANDPDPFNRPQDISFRTQRGDGFADATVRLPRRIDLDFPDLALLQKLRLVDDAGFIAYEGRVSEFPRDLDASGHSIVVTAAGYMASAKDRPFSELYVSRDFEAWRGPSAKRQADVASAAQGISAGTVATDVDTGFPALVMTHEGAWSVNQYVESYFDAGAECKVAKVYYDFVGPFAGGGSAHRYLYSSSGDASGFEENSGDIEATAGADYWTPTTPRRFMAAQWGYSGTGGTEGQSYVTRWRKLAAYGNHGLTPQGDAPGGFSVSQLLTNIVDRFCPQLDSSGIEETTYPVRHAVFQGITPYDAMLDLNRLHLWELSAWEDGVVQFAEPLPLDDWDWEIRTDDPGTTVSLQGDSLDGAAYNGIVVRYDDFQGNEQVITPDLEPDLRDDSSDNPANIWGIERWTEPPGQKITFPTTYDDAVQVGRAALGEAAQVKAPGEIRVSGYIRDRQGNKVPAHRARCGQRVRLANHPNDTPRRIVSTDWAGGEIPVLRITTDNVTKRVEGLFDRLEFARKAAGLG